MKIPALSASLLLAGLAACGGDGGGTPPGLTVTVPSGCATGVTADKLYTDVVQGTCAVSSCHGAGSQGTFFTISSAADMKAKWVSQASTQAPQVPRVTAGDANKSFVLYKLIGEQEKAAGQGKGGARMPLGGDKLSDRQICEFVSWIKEGAK